MLVFRRLHIISTHQSFSELLKSYTPSETSGLVLKHGGKGGQVSFWEGPFSANMLVLVEVR